MSGTDSRLGEAREASFQGRHQQAVDLCVSVLRQKPGDPTALAFLALCLWRGAGYAEAVDVLRRSLAHFPAQEELSLALLDSLESLGRDGEALQFVATLPDVVLAKPPFNSRAAALRERIAAGGPAPRVEHRLVKLHNEALYDQVERELLPLLQAYPRWNAGHILWASVMFNRGGLGVSSQDLQLPEHAATVADVQAMWRSTLAKSMSDYRGQIISRMQATISSAPEDPRARLILARTRFEDGLGLGAAELDFVAAELKIGLLGPFPLKSALDPGLSDAAAVRLLQPAAFIQIPEPRSVGARFDLAGAIGPALTNARYVAEAHDATAAAGSDVVLLSDGSAICDLLTHPLGEFTRYLSDGWIVLGATSQVALGRRPVTPVPGTAISLLGASANYYGHWLLDYLLRLRAIHQHPDAASATVLVEDGMPASHYQALGLLRNAGASILRVAPGDAVQVERLLFAGPDVFFPHASRNGAPMIPSLAPTSADGMEFLRQGVLAALGHPGRRGSRIVVRRRSATRRMLNEDEVCEMLLEQWGFEAVYPETLDFAAQVRRFHDADVVVGAQGSAMSNCVFCAPDTRVIDLCSGFAANFPSWADGLERLGMHHCFVVGEAMEDSHALAVQRDFRVDLDALRHALDVLGVTPRPKAS